MNLSKKEWVAVSVAVVFVGYTLFGGNITSLFKKTATMNNSNSAAVGATETPNQVAPQQQNIGGVLVQDVSVGQGAEVKKGDLVSAHYILSLSNGQVVQNSKDFGQPFKFVLGAGEVIPGWEIGFTGMKVGGVRTIVVPPELAYGANQAGPIPPNSTLIFTIEVVAAEPAPAQ